MHLYFQKALVELDSEVAAAGGCTPACIRCISVWLCSRLLEMASQGSSSSGTHATAPLKGILVKNHWPKGFSVFFMLIWWSHLLTFFTLEVTDSDQWDICMNICMNTHQRKGSVLQVGFFNFKILQYSTVYTNWCFIFVLQLALRDALLKKRKRLLK